METSPPAQSMAGSPGPSALVTAAYNDARDNRSLTAGLAGTSIALLTFALIFLFDKWSQGFVNGLVFQGAVLVIVTSVFLVGLSSMNFWFVMEALRSGHPAPERYVQRAETFFASSWILLLLEPALILASVKLDALAIVAASLWLVSVGLLISGWRDARLAPAPRTP